MGKKCCNTKVVKKKHVDIQDEKCRCKRAATIDRQKEKAITVLSAVESTLRLPKAARRENQITHLCEINNVMHA